MTQLDTGDIELSAGAVAELFRLYMRQWSLAVGRVDFAKTIGVSASRLNRAIAGATPAYDLAYRIVKTCRVSWPAIFTASSATIGTLKKIARAEEDRDISLSEREVAAEEAHTRARLRDIVGEFGFMECARGAGIAPASLHYYLDSTRLTLSLIWKVHLVTGTPYTAIASGKADSRELKLRESAGRDDEPLGRFEDAVEPVVRLVERYVYNEMSEAARPYVACTEKLLDRKLTLPQKMRVMKVLALYLDDMGDRKAAGCVIEILRYQP